MKIMFLNAWEAATGKILWNYIKEESKTTDIFCFMEAGKEFRSKCSEILTDYNLIFAEKSVVNEDGAFQSTYVKKNIKILNNKTILEDNHKIGLGLFTKIQNKNKILNLMSVHGVAFPGAKLDNANRLEQSQKIIDFMAKVEGEKIIGGDFNLDKNTESIRSFEKNGYRNLIEEYKIETTRNKLCWDRFPVKQLWADFLFVTPDIKVKSFEVPKNEVSDHLPLVLEIE